MIGSVGVYPMAWDGELIRRTCGESAGRYALGDCSVRWAYILAAIACLDAFILATLAFILATRHIKLQPEPIYTTNGSLYKGKILFLISLCIIFYKCPGYSDISLSF